MADPPPLFLRLSDAVHGPFGAEQLRELADGGAVNPQTEAATDPAGPWTALETFSQGAALFPAPQHFQFKKREIERVNHSQLPPVDHHELIAAANRPLTPRASSQPPPLPNDVVQILQGVARKQVAREALMDIKPRPNRRLRDFLVLMIPLNGLLIGAILWTGLRSPIEFVFLVAALGILNAGAAWIIFFLMDRY